MSPPWFSAHAACGSIKSWLPGRGEAHPAAFLHFHTTLIFPINPLVSLQKWENSGGNFCQLLQSGEMPKHIPAGIALVFCLAGISQKLVIPPTSLLLTNLPCSEKAGPKMPYLWKLAPGKNRPPPCTHPSLNFLKEGVTEYEKCLETGKRQNPFQGKSVPQGSPMVDYKTIYSKAMVRWYKTIEKPSIPMVQVWRRKRLTTMVGM